MPLLRVLFLILEAAGMYITSRPPNAAIPPARRAVPNWRETLLKNLALPCVGLRTIYWFVVAIEIAFNVSGYTGHAPRSVSKQVLAFLVPETGSAMHLHVTSMSIFGSVMTFLGAALRFKCYRTLGTLFTFELAILQEHRLIRDGPYAVVRHPSYTGMIMTIIGVVFSHSARGSWLRESGVLDLAPMRILVLYWLAVAIAVIASLFLRLKNEDEILERNFGSEWAEWAQEVPCRLVPGVY